MNVEVFRELSRLADSVVSPVVASRSRKRRMREELLAHLLDAFEQELARHPCESGEPDPCERDAALQATLARFGAPDELTSQLQHVAALQDPLRVHLAPFAASLAFAFVGHYLIHVLSALVYSFLVLKWIHVPHAPLPIFICQVIARLESMFVGVLFTRWIPTYRPLFVVPLAACLEAALPLVLPISSEPWWWNVVNITANTAATFLACRFAQRRAPQPSRFAAAE